MASSPLKLLLLPGLDGTGKLFSGLVEALENRFSEEVIGYPSNETLSYAELVEFVQSATPSSESYVLVAESFSTPVAIACASIGSAHLKGLILCAGFACSPIRPSLRWLTHFSRFVFAFTIPNFIARWLLLGRNASPSLLADLQSAVASVPGRVLSNRLKSVAFCDVRMELSKVAVPILYIQGTNDHLVSPSSVLEILHVKPDVVVSVIAAPHLVLQAEPEQAARTIIEFIHTLPRE